MNDLKIHDIKPLVEIPDYSLYIFILLVTVVSVIILSLIYFIYKIIRNKEPSLKKNSLEILKTLDLNDTKTSAYSITYHGRVVATAPRERKLFEELTSRLEEYKYKKEINSFDEETLHQLEIFMEAIDVK